MQEQNKEKFLTRKSKKPLMKHSAEDRNRMILTTDEHRWTRILQEETEETEGQEGGGRKFARLAQISRVVQINT